MEVSTDLIYSLNNSLDAKDLGPYVMTGKTKCHSSETIDHFTIDIVTSVFKDQYTLKCHLS